MMLRACVTERVYGSWFCHVCWSCAGSVLLTSGAGASLDCAPTERCAGACAGNILLTSDAGAPHGFAAKVADFGLARSLDLQSRIETRTYGTVTHMPHELLCSGIMSKARARCCTCMPWPSHPVACRIDLFAGQHACYAAALLRHHEQGMRAAACLP